MEIHLCIAAICSENCNPVLGWFFLFFLNIFHIFVSISSRLLEYWAEHGIGALKNDSPQIQASSLSLLSHLIRSEKEALPVVSHAFS